MEFDTLVGVSVFRVIWSGYRKNGNGKNGNGTNGNGNNGYRKNGKGNNGNMQNMEEMANLFYFVKYKRIRRIMVMRGQ